MEIMTFQPKILYSLSYNNHHMSLLRKIVLITLGILGTLLSVILLLLIFIGPIAEYAIEKYDEEYTGRRIEIADLSLNAFKGKILLTKFQLYELKSDTVFLEMDSLQLKINVWKAITGKYDIEQFIITGPRVRIVQSTKGFNFDDLMALGNDSTAVADTTVVDSSAEPIEYWLRTLALNNSSISYTDQTMGSSFVIEDFDFSADTISWNNPKHQYHLLASLQSGGKVKLDFGIDIEKFDYKLLLAIDSLDLHVVQNNLLPYLNISDFQGLLSTQLYAQGNFNDPDNLEANSTLKLEDFMIKDDRNRAFTTLKSFSFKLDTINTKNNMYAIDDILIVEPYVLFEMFSKHTNIDKLLKETEPSPAAPVAVQANDSDEQGPFEMLAEYMASFAKDFNENEYKISKAAIVAGKIDYADYTLNDPFKVKLTQFNVSTGKISSSNPSVSLKTSAVMNDKGKLAADAKISMKNYQNFMLNMNIESLPISSFNPYSTYFVAHPFWDGNINFKSNNSVQNNFLKSDNTLRVEEIEVGKKVKNKTAADVPVKLGVALLRDRNGDIEITIPIEGNLADPNYKIGKAVIKIVTNILVKAVTAPYDLLANSLKCDPNDLKYIAYDYTQERPNEKQIKNADLIAKVLEDKPGLNVEFTQAFNEEFEKNNMAIQAAKVLYRATNLDSISIDKINISDSLFIGFVNSKVRERERQQSMPEKCRIIYGEKELQKAAEELNAKRLLALRNYLVSTKGVKATRIKFNADRKTEADAYDIGKFLINFYAD